MVSIETIVILLSSVLLNFHVIRFWLFISFCLFFSFFSLRVYVIRAFKSYWCFTVSAYDYLIVNTIYRRSISTQISIINIIESIGL